MKVAEKYQNAVTESGSAGVSSQDLQTNCNMWVYQMPIFIAIIIEPYLANDYIWIWREGGTLFCVSDVFERVLQIQSSWFSSLSIIFVIGVSIILDLVFSSIDGNMDGVDALWLLNQDGSWQDIFINIQLKDATKSFCQQPRPVSGFYSLSTD